MKVRWKSQQYDIIISASQTREQFPIAVEFISPFQHAPTSSSRAPDCSDCERATDRTHITADSELARKGKINGRELEFELELLQGM
jgi:hypothetical protein